MSGRALIAVLAIAGAGCLVEVDYGGTRFSCAADGRCPPGFECSADLECVPPGSDGGVELGATGRVMSIDNSDGAALEGFPLLVRLTGTRVDYAAAGAGGDTLRFYADDRQTLLPHQIERWDPAGESLVWVRVDLAAGAVTEVLLTWAGDPLPAALPEADTFDDRFVGVWHLGEDPASDVEDALLDSSGAGLHATASAELDAGSVIDGPIAAAVQFGSVDSATVGDEPVFELPVYTWSMWLRGDAAPTNEGNGQPMFNADQQFNFSWDHVNPALAVAGGHFDSEGFKAAQVVTPVSGQTWYFIALSYDGAELAIYLDGQLEATAPAGAPIVSAGPFAFGNDPAAPVFSGALDEIRVASVARPAEWLALQHAAVIDAAIAYGEIESF
jgi:hypothetical protein